MSVSVDQALGVSGVEGENVRLHEEKRNREFSSSLCFDSAIRHLRSASFASCITRTYKSLMQSDAKRIHETDKSFIMCKIIVVVSIPKKK